jgi:hypothetical protein
MTEFSEFRTPKEMSNEEFFEHAFNYSKAGPLAQIIMVQAVMTYLDNELKYPRPEKDESWSIINRQGWHDACVILKKEFDEKYGK